MNAPSNKVLGIAIVLVTGALGFSLMGRDDAPPPKVSKAPSRATLERELRQGDVLKGPPDTPFTLRHPDRWERLKEADIPEVDPRPIAGLRRNNSAGLLTVSVGGPVEGGLAVREKTLRADLEQRLPDARVTAVRQVKVAAGPALYATLIRGRTKLIQTMLVIPDADRSYQVDAAIRPEARDAAAELGAMLRTFDVAGR
jgi:hypothetical protein